MNVYKFYCIKFQKAFYKVTQAKVSLDTVN